MLSKPSEIENLQANSTVDIFSQVVSYISNAKEARKNKDIKCIEYAEKAVNLAMENNLVFQAAEAKFEIANYYLNALKDFEAALHHALEALALLGSEEQSFLKANLFKFIGICYHWRGNFTNAISNYFQAITVLEGVELSSKEELLLAGSLHYNIILIYQHLAFDEEKFHHLQKAIEFYGKADFKDGLAKCFSLYADYHSEVKNLPQRRKELFEKALALFKETGNKIGELSCICPLGLVYCELGDAEFGFSLLNQGLKEMEATGVSGYAAAAHNYFARAYRYLKDYEKALEHYILVEELLLTANRDVELHDLYFEMAGTLAEAGDYKSAYGYRLKYSKVKDEWMNFDKATAIHNATMEFAIKRQEIEADFQQQKREQVGETVHKLKLLNEELKQIAYVASHDLREPLRMISSYTKLLAKQYTEPENNKVQEYTTVIQESTQRMVEMIQHMIALSKADAQVTLQPVDLNNLLAEVKSMLAIIIAHNNAEVLYGKLPVIKSNRTLLSQILQNLIVNAIKYNNSNRPTVEIVYFKHNNKHWFEVHDNGIGIPEEKREKIFFIFSRLHQEEVSGTGIGLAVCKKAVELLNGKIWAADSRLGGACIKFSIPVETELNFSLKNT